MKVQVKKFHKSGAVDDPSCYTLVDVKVGDGVCFKSDYEQCGTIEKIEIDSRGWNGRQVVLHLFNENGFGGEYLRYSQRTTVFADDCWL